MGRLGWDHRRAIAATAPLDNCSECARTLARLGDRDEAVRRIFEKVPQRNQVSTTSG